MKRKFLIAGGGTGGHIYPGIAIARAIENLDPEIEVEFVGSHLGLEKSIVPREGFTLHQLASGKVNYSGSVLAKVFGLFKVLVGFFQAAKLLIQLKPVGVLGVGGYASVPLVFVASLMKIPTTIWEPNAHPGLANRLLSHLVPRAFVVFEEAKKHLKSKIILQVGLPVRKELENILPKAPTDELHVLSFGGSQGAKAINDVLSQAVQKESQWLHKSKLIHQTGVSDYSKIKEIYDQSVFDVEVYEYLFEMDQFYSWADIVIARSGASTIAELAAVGKPALLIPLPTSADDHQRKNAMVLARAGAAIMIEQKDLTVEKINEVLLDLQRNPHRMSDLAQQIKLLHKPFAAESIAKSLLKL